MSEFLPEDLPAVLYEYEPNTCEINQYNVLGVHDNRIILEKVNVYNEVVTVGASDLDENTSSYWTTKRELIDALIQEKQAKIEKLNEDIVKLQGMEGLVK